MFFKIKNTSPFSAAYSGIAGRSKERKISIFISPPPAVTIFIYAERTDIIPYLKIIILN